MIRKPPLALAVVCATLLTSAPVLATDPCREYLVAKVVKEKTFRLLEEQRSNEAAAEVAAETAARWRQALEAVIASLRADGDELFERILVSWEKARNASEIAVADTLFWFMLAGDQNPHGKASAGFIAVADSVDAVYAAEHATIVLACRLRGKTQP